ncbi:hypothetical protein [Pimelobacter sp. 30-1]|uniref:hypothetical protein n=1 Tax=Pimelobacter sp. 30-1 TaxID=2004991 RepID=UPI001C04A4FF|nr:hypothetical protein [Pimelobacter sp. 30-1]
MRPTVAVRRRALLATLAAAVVGLSGCGALQAELDQKRGKPISFGDVENAVPAAVPRVVRVEDSSRWTNGFGNAAGFTLVTDSADPFTAEELDDVVRTIWTEVLWDISSLQLIAVTDDPAAPAGVDLRAAAAGLAPLGTTQAGQNGVTLTGLDARYG